ncbi:MAG: acylphosphatase [Desulfobacteraceae bacterium]|nr:acylphosphatase [Desulfobacteraceae bacterium]
MNTSTKRRIHAFISGRVQGVFYRASTMDEAARLGLTGWVKNLPDGRVELVAEGPPDKIEELISWCWQGPPYARVDHVTVQEEKSTDEFERFLMHY